MNLASWSASLALALTASLAAAQPQLVLVNGRVFTADPQRPWAQALAVDRGRIHSVGTDAEVRALAGPGTRVVDAGGRLVTPGLVEAHVHLGWNLPSAPLSLPGGQFPGPTAEQVLAAVTAAQGDGDGWISAWIGPLVARDRRNWRAALDQASPRRPVLLRAFWGHTSIVNSAALRKLGIGEDVADPIGGWWGRDPAGRLDGRVYESAEDIETRAVPPSAQALSGDYGSAAKQFAQWGVTAIHLMNTNVPLRTTLEALRPLQTGPKWTVYTWAGPVRRVEEPWQSMAASATDAPPHVRVEGPKWMLDGTGLEQNALLRQSYPGRPGWNGRSNVTDEQLREILRRGLASPHQLALHAVGDGQIDRLLAMMQELAPDETWRGKRVRLEHGDGLRADKLAVAAKLGLVVVQNPTHLPPPQPGRTIPYALMSGLLQGGVALALGSDGGPQEWNPFFNMMLATTYRAAPEQALTREQALLAYTSGGAYASRLERQTGRLAPGFAADLAVLSQDVLQVPAQALPATRSLLTLVDGVVIHEAPELSR